MATGILKRNSDDPVIEITLQNADGTAYNLTDCTVYATMYFPTTLADSIDASVTTIPLNSAALGIVEDEDYLMVGADENINKERMRLTNSGAPSTLTAGNADCTVEARPYTIPATAGVVYASDYVDGQGANIFVISTNATFDLAYDGNAASTVTVTAASTSNHNTISDLVTTVQTAVDSAVTGGNVVVGNVGNQLTFTSATTGTSSSIEITNPNSYATDELGISAAIDYGESSVTTTATTHTSGDTVNVVKFFDRECHIVSPATDGKFQYRWQSGDTNLITTYYFEFTCVTSQGRAFRIPSNTSSSITIQIVEDTFDHIVYDGE